MVAKQNKTLADISRTKTIATVGPASESLQVLKDLIDRGVDVFRLNMAHGDRESHEKAIARIRQAEAELQTSVAILIDLAGPKIRLGQLVEEPKVVTNGQTLVFVRGSKPGSPDELTCTYEGLIDEVQPGQAIVLADGLVRLQVTGKTEDRVECTVIDGGTFRSRQGVNLPATQLSIPALGEKDRDNAIWASTQSIDFVSLSFVRNAGEIEELKALLQEHGCQAGVIAKIEKREALDNLDEIVIAGDGVMVARGDLGVEIEIYKTPVAQKRIIQACLLHRKPVIVATQMLESMHTSKQPTRAEVSDVANAILDGADACMLSGETAIGQYPAEAVTMMQQIMLETEQLLKRSASKISGPDDSHQNDVAEAVMFGAAQIAQQLEAKMVVISSSTGETALIKSKQRDFIPTVCLTHHSAVARFICLYWGVIPVRTDSPHLPEKFRGFVNELAKSFAGGQIGDPVVMVTDNQWMPDVHDNILVGRIS
ncbi:MAG: pyruvate kinase [Planctomycetota bacterium]|nr:pyruvate kinase [Planctomycetota bacterium]